MEIAKLRQDLVMRDMRVEELTTQLTARARPPRRGPAEPSTSPSAAFSF